MSVHLARNVDVDLGSDPSTWPFEALVSVLARGLVGDWQPVIAALSIQPWGPLADRVLAATGLVEDPRVLVLFREIISDIRAEREASEREAVAAEIRKAVRSTGLSQAAFAARIGTSGSRLSTYCSGQVTPSGAMLKRIHWAATQAHAS